jgi:hypothetical protein
MSEALQGREVFAASHALASPAAGISKVFTNKNKAILSAIADNTTLSFFLKGVRVVFGLFFGEPGAVHDFFGQAFGESLRPSTMAKPLPPRAIVTYSPACP